MICAELYVTADGTIVGYHISGHAGFADAGQDVVCAFVSSAAYLTANTITDVIHAQAQAEASEGEMLVRVGRKDVGRCREVLEGLKLHLLQTEEQYPEFVKVIFTEV